ncbi:MAG: hypothetical protein ACO1SX_02925 [Actinomycetota bacterium]
MRDASEMTAREFADEVDRLGEAGESQDDIAAVFGLTKSQVRYKLMSSGYTWNSETRVRIAGTGQRLAQVRELTEAA